MNHWLAILPGGAYIPKRHPKMGDKERERQKKYRDANRAALRIKWRAYRQKNRAEINKRRRERYSKGVEMGAQGKGGAA